MVEQDWIREELSYKREEREEERERVPKKGKRREIIYEREREREGIVFCLILVQETHIHGWFVQQF